MLETKTAETTYHAATNHSYLSVLIDPNYVDASTQPSAYKQYPRFFRRFPLENGNPGHELIRLSSTITFKKIYRDGSYPLRVNPSAGALFPTELYVQLRGIRGTIDGIYHVEVAANSLTLIYELIDDGLEAYLLPDQIVKGMIFLVSCVYFRSSWKYKNRSLRYCFLDSGHHLGAIEASAYLHQRPIQALFDFDKLALNQDLGFENKEFVTAAMIAGELKQKPVRRLRSPLPIVCGTDYFEPNPFVETAYRDTLSPSSGTQPLQQPQFELNLERFSQTILDRRSARRFRQQFISRSDFDRILEAVEQPLPSTSLEDIEAYLIVNRVEGMEPGLYRGRSLLKAGNFSEQAGYLCVNQAIARDSAFTLFFLSHYQNYQTAMQLAGWLGHRLYLLSNYLSIGCSGIGAYYDDEVREFLESNKDVLYAVAIGI